MSKKKKDKPSAAKVVAKQYKKARKLYHETIGLFDNMKVKLDAAKIADEKYSQLQLDFVTFIERFGEFNEIIKRNKV